MLLTDLQERVYCALVLYLGFDPFYKLQTLIKYTCTILENWFYLDISIKIWILLAEGGGS